MLGTVKLTAAELEALPVRDFYGPPPAAGSGQFKAEIPDELRRAHEGRRWLIGKHVPPDAASGVIDGRPLSRMLWKYVEVVG